MTAILRKIGNKARASDAPGPQLAAIGLKRKKANPSRRVLATDPPWVSADEMHPGTMKVAFGVVGSASPRARAENATGLQLAVVDATQPWVENEAATVPWLILTHSPISLFTTKWPPKVRLYGRWATQRGETSAWSYPVSVTVV